MVIEGDERFLPALTALTEKDVTPRHAPRWLRLPIAMRWDLSFYFDYPAQEPLRVGTGFGFSFLGFLTSFL